MCKLRYYGFEALNMVIFPRKTRNALWPSEKFKNEEQETLRGQDSCQTKAEPAKPVVVTQAGIFKCLKSWKFILRQSYWMPYELKQRDVERRSYFSEILIERGIKKSFWNRIVIDEEKREARSNKHFRHSRISMWPK